MERWTEDVILTIHRRTAAYPAPARAASQPDADPSAAPALNRPRQPTETGLMRARQNSSGTAASIRPAGLDTTSIVSPPRSTRHTAGLNNNGQTDCAVTNLADKKVGAVVESRKRGEEEKEQDGPGEGKES